MLNVRGQGSESFGEVTGSEWRDPWYEALR